MPNISFRTLKHNKKSVEAQLLYYDFCAEKERGNLTYFNGIIINLPKRFDRFIFDRSKNKLLIFDTIYNDCGKRVINDEIEISDIMMDYPSGIHPVDDLIINKSTCNDIARDIRGYLKSPRM